jgi:hypothetical protein
MAALNQLSLAIDELAGPRRWREGFTPDEQRLRGQYYDAAEKIRSEAHATLSDELGPGFHGPFAKSPLRKWYSLQWAYESDPDGRRATLSRYLPAGLVAQFDAAAGSPPGKPEEARDWSWLIWWHCIRRGHPAAQAGGRRAAARDVGRCCGAEPASTSPHDRHDADQRHLPGRSHEVLDTWHRTSKRPAPMGSAYRRATAAVRHGIPDAVRGHRAHRPSTRPAVSSQGETAKVLKRLMGDPRVLGRSARRTGRCVRTAEGLRVSSGGARRGLILAAYEMKSSDDNFVLDGQVFDRAARKAALADLGRSDRMRLRSRHPPLGCIPPATPRSCSGRTSLYRTPDRTVGDD